MGQTTVNGRLIASQRGEPISFRAVSAACDVNGLAAKTPGDYNALIADPPATGR